MKKQIFYFGLVTLVLILGITSAQTSNSAVRGTIALDRNLTWPGRSQTTIPDWIGNVTINGVVYGMAFFQVSTGKPFDSGAQGNAKFFGEIWTIYDSISYHFIAPGNLVSWTPGTVLLNGTDSGNLATTNFLYRMNGVINYAHGVFQMYLGHQVHMNGQILFYPFGAPSAAPGTFQID